MSDYVIRINQSFKNSKAANSSGEAHAPSHCNPAVQVFCGITSVYDFGSIFILRVLSSFQPKSALRVMTSFYDIIKMVIYQTLTIV